MQHARNASEHRTPVSTDPSQRRGRPGAGGSWQALITALPLCVVLGGCSPNAVSIGSGEVALEEPADNPTCPGGIVPRSVTTTTQAGIDALEGCTEVAGDLTLVSFPGMHLVPLSELRIVRGDLDIGGDSGGRNGREVFLNGLESLEEVNSLRLAFVMDPDLSALRSLRRIAWQPGSSTDDAGRLWLRHCDAIRSLAGLDALTTFEELLLTQNARLTSLAGLRAPSRLRTFDAAGNGELEDVSALGSVRTIDQLSISQTGVLNLDGLQLETVGLLRLYENPALTNVASLDSLTSLEALLVIGNERLEGLPGLSGVANVRRVSIVGNDQLRSVPSFYDQAGESNGFALSGHERDLYWYPLPEDPTAPIPTELSPVQARGFDLLEVAGNPRLTRIAVPLPERAGHAVIYGNASLAEVDFSSAAFLDALIIHDNAALRSVTLFEAAGPRVVDLRVTSNPQLATAFFEALPAMNRVIAGNLPAAP